MDIETRLAPVEYDEATATPEVRARVERLIAEANAAVPAILVTSRVPRERGAVREYIAVRMRAAHQPGDDDINDVTDATHVLRDGSKVHVGVRAVHAET